MAPEVSNGAASETKSKDLAKVGWKFLRRALRTVNCFKTKTNIVTHKKQEVQDVFRRNVKEHKVALEITATDEVLDPRRQGDASAYTSKAIAARKRIARSEKVVSLITILWECVVLAKEEAPRDRIRKQTFVSLMTNFHQLLQDSKPKEAIVALAEDDWVRDLGAEAAAAPDATMEFCKFYCSIYELVDTWCATVCSVDYEAMLTAILEYAQLVLPLQGDGIATEEWLNRRAEFARLRSTTKTLLEGGTVSTPPLATLEALTQWRDTRLVWTMEMEGRSDINSDGADGTQTCLVRGSTLLKGMEGALGSYFDKQTRLAEGKDGDDDASLSRLSSGVGNDSSHIEGSTFSERGEAMARANYNNGDLDRMDLDDDKERKAKAAGKRYWRGSGAVQQASDVIVLGEWVQSAETGRLAGSLAAQRFKVGSRVQVQRDGAWCTGVVIKFNDGLYDVRYDKTDAKGREVVDRNLPLNCLKAVGDDDTRPWLSTEEEKQGFGRLPLNRATGAASKPPQGDGFAFRESKHNVATDTTPDFRRKPIVARQMFNVGSSVIAWVNNKWMPGVVTRFHPEEKSYTVKTDEDGATCKVPAKCLKSASKGASPDSSPGAEDADSLTKKRSSKKAKKVARRSSKPAKAWTGVAHDIVTHHPPKHRSRRSKKSSPFGNAAGAALTAAGRRDLTGVPHRRRLSDSAAMEKLENGPSRKVKSSQGRKNGLRISEVSRDPD